MTTMPPPPPPAAPAAPSTPPTAPTKKGISPWAWVGVGCGCLLLLTILVVGVGGYLATKKVKEVAKNFEENPTRATAELIVGLNPDLELIDATDDGKVTVLQVSTGEEMTLDLEDLKEGRISFEGPDGDVTFDAEGGEEGGTLKITTDEGTSTFSADTSIDDLPEWVPLYARTQKVSGSFHSQSPDGVLGMATLETADSVDEVLDYYRGEFERMSYSVHNDTVSTTNGQRVGSLSAKGPEGRQLTVSATPSSGDGTTVVVLNYSEKH